MENVSKYILFHMSFHCVVLFSVLSSLPISSYTLLYFSVLVIFHRQVQK